MVITGCLNNEEKNVLEKRNSLRRRFHELEDTAIELADAKWTIISFRRLLTRLPFKYRDDHIEFVMQQTRRFLDAKTIQEIFAYLDSYWSYLSTDLLEYILDELGDEESKQKLKHLNEEVAEFRKMTPLNVYWRIEEIDPASKPIPEDLLQLVTVHKPESLSGKSTLDEVEEFRKQFATTFTIYKVALCVSKISPGSVRIVWLVPPSVAPLLHTDIQLHPEKLEKLGLISATLCSSTIYSGGKWYYVHRCRACITAWILEIVSLPQLFTVVCLLPTPLINIFISFSIQ